MENQCNRSQKESSPRSASSGCVANKHNPCRTSGSVQHGGLITQNRIYSVAKGRQLAQQLKGQPLKTLYTLFKEFAEAGLGVICWHDKRKLLRASDHHQRHLSIRFELHIDFSWPLRLPMRHAVPRGSGIRSAKNIFEVTKSFLNLLWDHGRNLRTCRPVQWGMQLAETG